MHALARGTKLIEPVLFVVTLKTRVTKNHAPLASICSFRAFFFLPAALAVSPLLTCTLFLAFRKRETIVSPLPPPFYQPSRVLFRKIFDTRTQAHAHARTHICAVLPLPPFLPFFFSWIFYGEPYGEYNNCLLNKIKNDNIHQRRIC